MKRAKKIAVIVLVFMLAISSCGLMQSSSVSAAKHSGKLAGRQTKSNALKEKWENRIKNKVYLGAVSPPPGRALKSRIIKEKVQYLSKKESMKRAKKRGTRPKFELPENIKEQLEKIKLLDSKDSLRGIEGEAARSWISIPIANLKRENSMQKMFLSKLHFSWIQDLSLIIVINIGIM